VSIADHGYQRSGGGLCAMRSSSRCSSLMLSSAGSGSFAAHRAGFQRHDDAQLA
jgi:hypothetical protein